MSKRNSIVKFRDYVSAFYWKSIIGLCLFIIGFQASLLADILHSETLEYLILGVLLLGYALMMWEIIYILRIQKRIFNYLKARTAPGIGFIGPEHLKYVSETDIANYLGISNYEVNGYCSKYKEIVKGDYAKDHWSEGNLDYGIDDKQNWWAIRLMVDHPYYWKNIYRFNRIFKKYMDSEYTQDNLNRRLKLFLWARNGSVVNFKLPSFSKTWKKITSKIKYLIHFLLKKKR